MSDHPPVLAIIGKKNSGKTTLLVALAAELRRRGLRVASVKHCHHDFEVDTPGTDSFRHFHEGGVEAVLIASPEKVAFVQRQRDGDRDPEPLLRHYLAGHGYDLILIEAFKHTPFPRVEVFRAAAHADPVYRPEAGGPPYVAIVTDSPERFNTPFPVIVLGTDEAHVTRLVGTVLRWLAEQGDGPN
jgi:molybdopterin-guanine dinucleotide biosynthesis protein MobB